MEKVLLRGLGGLLIFNCFALSVELKHLSHGSIVLPWKNLNQSLNINQKGNKTKITFNYSELCLGNPTLLTSLSL